MERRSFIGKTVLGAAGVLCSSTVSAPEMEATPKLIKPKRLKKGSIVGLITPASPLTTEAYKLAIQNVKDLGYKVKLSDNFNARAGFLAGTDEQRLDDLHQMFADPEVDGIICGRGGYGTGRLLDQLDYDLIKRNPKALIGFSDITALHFAIYKYTGLVTFHGPVASSDFTSLTKASFLNTIRKGSKEQTIEYPREWSDKGDKEYAFEVINEGQATGTLVGGNLSIVCSIMGTPYDVDFDGRIVFLEEIGEKPYRVDRMITQLVNSGKLDKAAGVVMGVFADCSPSSKDAEFLKYAGLSEILKDRFSSLNVPVMYGMPFGHISDNVTLPMGIRAEIDTKSRSLKILESSLF